MGKASRLVVTMVMDLNTAVALSVTLSMLRMSPIHRQGSQTGACSPGTAYQHKADATPQGSRGHVAVRTSLDVGATSAGTRVSPAQS